MIATTVITSTLSTEKSAESSRACSASLHARLVAMRMPRGSGCVAVIGIHILLLALLVTTPAVAAEIAVQLTLPAGWEQGPLDRNEKAYFLKAQQSQGATAKQKLQVTIFQAASRSLPPNKDGIRDLAEILRDGTAPSAAEPQLTLKRFGATDGYVFTATRKPSQAVAYKQLVQGVWTVGAYIVNFALLTNDAAGGEVQSVLDALQKLRITEG